MKLHMKLHKSRANVVVVMKDRHFDAFYLKPFHVSYIKRMSVKKYDKKSYASIGTNGSI